MLTLASFFGCDPLPRCKHWTLWGLGGSGYCIHGWGCPKLPTNSFAVWRWGKWQFVSRGDRGWVAPSTLGVGFVRGPGIDRVAEKEIQRRCHFGWFWNIAFQETSSHCCGSSEIRFVSYKTEWMEDSTARVAFPTNHLRYILVMVGNIILTSASGWMRQVVLVAKSKPGILVFLKEGSVLQGLRGPKSIPCACNPPMTINHQHYAGPTWSRRKTWRRLGWTCLM